MILKKLLRFWGGVFLLLLHPLIVFCDYFGSLVILLLQTLSFCPAGIPFRKNSKGRYILAQMARIGFEAIPIVGLMAFLIGFTLALQSAIQLERFGASIYIADLVAKSLTRELAPILIAIIIAGRSGSAIAAEIGTMKVTEEIIALKAMGVHPIKVLVMPKLLALLVVLPCLVLLADIVGIMAGFVVGVSILGINLQDYYNQTVKILSMQDLWAGASKCFAFAVVIAMVGCYRGFSVKGGGEGVGKATTQAVVDSILLIVVVNALFTSVSYFSS